MTKILLVVAHPRSNSLTHAAAAAFKAASEQRGHVVEVADLVGECFDPVLREDDEPDWSDPHKQYSPAVRREMARIERNETTVLLFPVWWWSMPAVLKGWIDRVWNHGWAYGGGTYPHRRVLAIGIAGSGKGDYEKGAYDEALRTQVENGLLKYCGVAEARLVLLYGALEGPASIDAILAQVSALGETF